MWQKKSEAAAGVCSPPPQRKQRCQLLRETPDSQWALCLSGHVRTNRRGLLPPPGRPPWSSSESFHGAAEGAATKSRTSPRPAVDTTWEDKPEGGCLPCVPHRRGDRLPLCETQQVPRHGGGEFPVLSSVLPRASQTVAPAAAPGAGAAVLPMPRSWAQPSPKELNASFKGSCQVPLT